MAAEPELDGPRTGEPAAEREPRRLGRFTPADMRLLVITFAATAGANLITILLVGFAIIVARVYGRIYPGHEQSFAWQQLVVMPLFGLVSLALIGWSRKILRRNPHSTLILNTGSSRFFFRGFICIVVFWVVLGLLVAVGLASGIK